MILEGTCHSWKRHFPFRSMVDLSEVRESRADGAYLGDRRAVVEMSGIQQQNLTISTCSRYSVLM